VRARFHKSVAQAGTTVAREPQVPDRIEKKSERSAESMLSCESKFTRRLTGGDGSVKTGHIWGGSMISWRHLHAIEEATMTSDTASNRSHPARRFGYLVAVMVNVILWFLVNARPGWRTLPFLTEGFPDVLWLVNLSLATSAAVNVVYLGYDRAWLKSVCQIGVSAIGLAAAIRMLQVFPFDFSSSAFPWTAVTRLLLILAIFGSVVAVLVELVKLAGHSGGDAVSGQLPSSGV